MSAFDGARIEKSSTQEGAIKGSDRSFNVAMVMIMVLLVVFAAVIFIRGSQEDADQKQKSDANQQQPLTPSTP